MHGLAWIMEGTGVCVSCSFETSVLQKHRVIRGTCLDHGRQSSEAEGIQTGKGVKVREGCSVQRQGGVGHHACPAQIGGQCNCSPVGMQSVPGQSRGDQGLL